MDTRTKPSRMYVVKRNGVHQEVHWEKISRRISQLCYSLNFVDYQSISQTVIKGLKSGMTTAELDDLAAETAASCVSDHPDYGVLAARIVISNLYKNKTTNKSFLESCRAMHGYVNPKNKQPSPLISDQCMDFIAENALEIEAAIVHKRDEMFDYFGFKTLERAYLLKMNNKVAERIQHMLMRVAVGINCGDLAGTLQTYELMSLGLYIHASPTLFNAGTPNPQLSSCFLLQIREDSIEGIYDTLKRTAVISKGAGGIGVAISNVRAEGSYIRGTNGISNGTAPMLRVFNTTGRYVDQGGGKRKGAFACYLEPWHADVRTFLELRKNSGVEEQRARDLFLGLWTPDLFMRRVKADGNWSLFCPAEAEGLDAVWGDEFDALYAKHEATPGLAREVMKARDLFGLILRAQCETGLPYMMFKDACNRKSNQQNLGTIKCSNLCVAGDTSVLTQHGQVKIAQLAALCGPVDNYSSTPTPMSVSASASAGVSSLPDQSRSPRPRKTVPVWNGNKWSDVTVMRTNADQRMVAVEMSNGARVVCTEHHKFITAPQEIADVDSSEDPNPNRCNNNNNSNLNRIVAQTTNSIRDASRVDAVDLKVGTQLMQWTLPQPLVGDTTQDIVDPYIKGFNLSRQQQQQHWIPAADGGTNNNNNNNNNSDEDLNQIPVNASQKCKLAWLAGYIDAAVQDKKTTTENKGSSSSSSTTMTSSNVSLLRKIQLMLQTLGVVASIALVLPISWKILIPAAGMQQLLALGLDNSRITAVTTTGTVPAAVPAAVPAVVVATVTKVTPLSQRSDSYCFAEPENQAGVFGGVLTGQCTEIVEYVAPDEIAVCNLASVALPKFVNTRKKTFDFGNLFEVVKIMTKNLNKVIDVNHYPLVEAKNSNLRHRPIGLGVQGLADVFIKLRLPFDSPGARALNRDIFETIYFAALTASMELAKLHGPYETYPGSPISRGILQFDMWNVTPASGRWNWTELRAEIKSHGVRNSLLVAPMPTATTSQILGNNESFEPYTSNLYLRRTLAGEFVCVSRHLLEDLIALGIWNADLKNKLISANGSVQNIPEIPSDLKALYKTVWEISAKSLLEMAADRGAYIDQSQSMNIYLEHPSLLTLSRIIMYGWELGLKTGAYYVRTKPAADAIKVTVDQKSLVADVSAGASSNGTSSGSGSGSGFQPPITSFNTESKSLPSLQSMHEEDELDRKLNAILKSSRAIASSIARLSPGMAKTPVGASIVTPTSTTTSSPSSSSSSSSLSTTPPANTEQATDIETWRKDRELAQEKLICSLRNREACTMCSS